ncbi:hypothetical protein [Rhizobium leguminosarum]|uniref:hypothetical protein n=1 Tax=Rhizobium leguminosarum TaxID=384 RepID=UPI00143F93DE|nr:hypothetical protein [Rhizobium leguminosarum]
MAATNDKGKKVYYGALCAAPEENFAGLKIDHLQKGQRMFCAALLRGLPGD